MSPFEKIIVEPSDDENGGMEVEDSEEESDYDEESENDEESEDDEESGNEGEVRSRVYLPSQEGGGDQELEHDETAYVCYHALKTGSPCLSFDVLPDSLGEDRADRFPLSMLLVGGTQVSHQANRRTNSLLVMRLSNMHRNKEKEEDEEEEKDEEEDSESDDDDEEAKKPVLECASIPHAGCVNRVKVRVLGDDPYAATFSETGKVHLWNLSEAVLAVNDARAMAAYIQERVIIKPTFTFSGHLQEGNAIDWSPLVPGVLASGDGKSNIHLWKPLEGGSWHVDQRPYTAHTDSVEDIQWSPSENNVLASCSVDKSIRIWDIRATPNKACMLTKENAHDSDVNVISWNSGEPFILSGGDDGKIRVWDLRKFPGSDPVCTFKYHTAPITAVEWHPTDHSTFAASAADDILTQWDLAVERDDDAQNEEGAESADLMALPPQLLFLHQGQKEIKELHWHKQMPGVLISTALSGFNVIRTISV